MKNNTGGFVPNRKTKTSNTANTATASAAQAPQPTAAPEVQKPQSKPWYQSKTIWFNLGVGVLGAAAASLPELKPMMNPMAFMVLSNAVNIGLRFVTKKAIKKS